MPVSTAGLSKLTARVGEFYITDRAMKKAQDRITDLLAQNAVDEVAEAAYLEAVKRYFDGFEREARGHLRSVDKRLEQINQVHFNLTAERSVAVRRIEGTQTVLAELDSLRNGSAAR
ncbi:MAG: hypothetical protein M3126_10225 [Candidatus Eremiobacteraeota bacterium]|nr:hypothetical protein [Candidatus Eremiobacteraeota bacterium]